MRLAGLVAIVSLAAPALAAASEGGGPVWHLRVQAAAADLDPVATRWVLRLEEKLAAGAPGVVVGERSQGLRAVTTRPNGRPDRTFDLDAPSGAVTITDDRHSAYAKAPIARRSRRDRSGTLRVLGPVEARTATADLPRALRKEIIAERRNQPTVQVRRVITENAGWVVDFARIGAHPTWHELRPEQGDRVRVLVRSARAPKPR